MREFESAAACTGVTPTPALPFSTLWFGFSFLGYTMNEQLIQDFYDGKRSKDLPFVLNDTAKILRGVYASRSGAVVSIDISEAIPKFLIEFGDGTDELVPLDNLERKEN